MPKTAKPKNSPKYFLMYSDCGDDVQAERYSDKTYSSIAEAKKDVYEEAITTTKKFYVVQIVAIGNQKTLSWS